MRLLSFLTLHMQIDIIFALLAYFIGSVSFAVLISKVYGLQDPRTFGSKNPGATNVLRTGNKVAALLTLLGDGFKGWLAVFLANYFGPQFGLSGLGQAMVVLAVFLGHCFPIWHRFQGGKGVATALGVLLAVNGWLGLATLTTWLVVAYAFKYSSLAALMAALFAPFYTFLLFGIKPIAIAVGIMSLVLILRHRSNIKKLFAGKETRIGQKKTDNKSEEKA